MYIYFAVLFLLYYVLIYCTVFIVPYLFYLDIFIDGLQLLSCIENVNDVLKNLVRSTRVRTMSEQRANTTETVLKKEGKWLDEQQIVALKSKVLKEIKIYIKNINIDLLRYCMIRLVSYFHYILIIILFYFIINQTVKLI